MEGLLVQIAQTGWQIIDLLVNLGMRSLNIGLTAAGGVPALWVDWEGEGLPFLSRTGFLNFAAG